MRSGALLPGGKAFAVLILAILLLWGGEQALPGTMTTFQVIVNEGNPVTSLGREELSRIFLKKTSRWEDGTVILPVEPARTSALHKAFVGEIHEMREAFWDAYWQQRIFSGRALPPPTKPSDAEVLEYVRENRGAIGYVSSEAELSGVRAVGVR